MSRDRAWYEKYRKVLLAEAERLTAASKVPVRIGALCRDLGIPIVRSSSIQENRALLVLKDASFEIRLPLMPSGRDWQSPLERFQVAHEIAHLILYQRFSVAPGDRREYYKHEFLADEFAATVLLPASAIPILDSEPDAMARIALHEVRRISRIAHIPASGAAQRFCALNVGIAMFGIALDDKMRVMVRFSTFPSRRKVGTVLRPPEPFEDLLRSPGAARKGAVRIAMETISPLVAAESANAAYAQWIGGALLLSVALRK